MHTFRPAALALSLACAGLITACATSPLGRAQLKLFPDSELDAMGATAFQETSKKTPVTSNGRATAYVNCITNALIREVGGSWEVKVFESNDVNAFALPGGKIGVYTGLLKITETPDQLAAVIGHEIAHVIAGHSNERVSQQQVAGIGMTVAQVIVGGGPAGGAMMSALGAGAQYGVLLPFSRTHESEADLVGLDYMARAGFDPRQAVALWQNMGRAGGQKPPEFASSHPSDETRIRQIQERLPKTVPVYVEALAGGKRPDCRRPA